MSNHEKIAIAIASHAGKTLSAKEIVALAVARYPDANKSSILVADHSTSNVTGCKCAHTDARLFDRIGQSQYVIRPNPAPIGNAPKRTKVAAVPADEAVTVEQETATA